MVARSEACWVAVSGTVLWPWEEETRRGEYFRRNGPGKLNLAMARVFSTPSRKAGYRAPPLQWHWIIVLADMGIYSDREMASSREARDSADTQLLAVGYELLNWVVSPKPGPMKCRRLKCPEERWTFPKGAHSMLCKEHTEEALRALQREESK